MQTEQTPLDYHIYFIKTKSCQFCHQPLRAALHAFYHWRKYHQQRPVTVNNKPQYFVWFEQEWVEVNMETCMSAMLEKRCTLITKPRNVTSKLKGD